MTPNDLHKIKQDVVNAIPNGEHLYLFDPEFHFAVELLMQKAFFANRTNYINPLESS